MSQWSVAKRHLAAVTAALMLINFTAAGAETAPPTGGVETGGEKIVFFRHGEKPSGDWGSSIARDSIAHLSCRKFSRTNSASQKLSSRPTRGTRSRMITLNIIMSALSQR